MKLTIDTSVALKLLIDEPGISREDALVLVGQWRPLLDELHPASELAADALELAFEIDHAAYDCYFPALAKQEDAVLVTANARFLNALAPTAYREHARLL